MRVAALYDIHGNVHALDAVLAEIDHARPDVILIGGDIVAGPFPIEVLERLMGRGDVRFIRGNTEREILGQGLTPSPSWAERMYWVRDRLSPAHRAFLENLPEQMVLDVQGLGPVLFVHGSPRSDEEIITALTSDQRLSDILTHVKQRFVIGGHTHMQLDRTVDRIRYVNSGSVGMPYEDEPGAYWLLLGPGIEHRRTDYDLDAATAAIRASDFPDVEDFVTRYLLKHPTPQETAAFFEKITASRPPL